MKKLIKFGVICLAAMAVTACKEKGGPDEQPGIPPAKPSELTCLNGKERVQLKFTLTSDEAISKVVIYWNDKANNQEVEVKWPSQSGKELKADIKDLAAGDYTFQLYTYSSKGTESEEPATVTGKAYAADYAKDFTAYTVEGSKYTNGGKDVKITLADATMPDEAVGINVKYTDKLNTLVDIFVEDPDGEVVLEDIDYTKGLKYSTVYKPEATALDTFNTPEKTATFVEAELMPEVVEVAKPYAAHHIEGFDSPEGTGNGIISNLWDGSDTSAATGVDVWTTEPWAGTVNGQCFQAVLRPEELAAANAETPGFFYQPLWYTIDLGKAARLSKIHVYFYYPFARSFPRQMEYWAYTGAGEPGANWTGWELIGTSEDIPTSYATTEDALAAYKAGNTTTFKAYGEAPLARYYKMKCIKAAEYNDSEAADKQTNWRSFYFSLSEVTFYKYDE